MDLEFIISKLDFNVTMNKNELFGVCVDFCSILPYKCKSNIDFTQKTISFYPKPPTGRLLGPSCNRVVSSIIDIGHDS